MFQFQTAQVQGKTVITAFLDGELLITDSDNPNFDEILDRCEDIRDGYLPADEQLFHLFVPANKAAAIFERISDRVSVRDGALYLDGDPVENSLSHQVLRAIEEDVPEDEWIGFVRYFENVQANPEDHSREQLFDWISQHDVTITTEGDLLAYKGVYDGANGGWTSGSSGTAIVNGQVHTGRIPYAVGDVVEMPRSAVAHDPYESCSTGLHVGTFDYAQSWARGAMLKVRVNPRDVVSVPTDGGGAKIRVCRFEILEVIDAPETRAVVSYLDNPFSFDDEPEAPERDEWGRFVPGNVTKAKRDRATGRFVSV